MAKQSQVEKVLVSLKADRAVLDLAIAKIEQTVAMSSKRMIARHGKSLDKLGRLKEKAVTTSEA